MMQSVLTVIYSLPFLLGFVAGLIGMRAAQETRCRWLERHQPLPDGKRRRVGGLIAFGVLGYVLVQVGQTEQHYRDLGNEMRRCQIEFNTSLNKRAEITQENDRLSREQRDLFAELERLQAVWIGRLINLPPELIDLPQADVRVQDYGRTVTRIYQERAETLRGKVDAISKRQAELERERAANPLPPPSCGQ
ncbi:membrane protein [Mycobacterium phage Thonko]|uniref:Membrane protein n=1 Tax=Mycobacterium phage Thonko TaxID=2282910 RepID=A0A346FC65_9CAUD|nr:membrane protein [Mycobacterium phage Thonko]AXN53290.1 membrane protein [Mycobacterium phage Thonko]